MTINVDIIYANAFSNMSTLKAVRILKSTSTSQVSLQANVFYGSDNFEYVNYRGTTNIGLPSLNLSSGLVVHTLPT